MRFSQLEWCGSGSPQPTHSRAPAHSNNYAAEALAGQPGVSAGANGLQVEQVRQQRAKEAAAKFQPLWLPVGKLEPPCRCRGQCWRRHHDPGPNRRCMLRHCRAETLRCLAIVALCDTKLWRVNSTHRRHLLVPHHWRRGGLCRWVEDCVKRLRFF